MEIICKLENINKQFGTKKILNNFSLEVMSGDYLCITGKSGTGKTTLLNIIGLLESCKEGTIELFGIKNIQVNAKAQRQLLREKIGFLFQNFALIDDETVDYNLDIAKINNKCAKKEWQNRKEEILKKLDLNGVFLTDKIFQLSGGEQQRIALARLVLKKCDLILADEPTGSLDTVNRNTVLDILDSLNKQGKTIIIVSHDPYVIKRSKKVITLT